MTLAPIILFAYRRPDHLRRTLDALLSSPEAGQSDLFVFCDGARVPEDEPGVAGVRQMIQNLTGFKSIHKTLRDDNRGLAKSIISGVTEVLKSHECAIVVEDDLVVSPGFLAFMNAALDFYRDEPKVGSVCGYFYPVGGTLPKTFFLREADCWGWATWRRGWAHFEADGKKLLGGIESRQLSRKFDVQGSYPYVQMLQDQIAGKNNSWAIRWQASLFLADKLTLYPGKSLVQNIGFDGSGEHCGATSVFQVEMSKAEIPLKSIPIVENLEVETKLAVYFRNLQRPATTGLLSRFKNRVFRVVRALYGRSRLAPQMKVPGETGCGGAKTTNVKG